MDERLSRRGELVELAKRVKCSSLGVASADELYLYLDSEAEEYKDSVK